jgi:hypothetical protein
MEFYIIKLDNFLNQKKFLIRPLKLSNNFNEKKDRQLKNILNKIYIVMRLFLFILLDYFI